MASKNQRWMVDSGILRKKTTEEEPQELLVFGYSCKLFRDDEKAKMIDQGKHLIPWMGDNTLKIDRYDGRGALGDLRVYEPPPGGFDQRTFLTEDEYKIEQLCDEERYRSLYKSDADENLYHEEEMKRLQQALDSENSYGQVAYNYNENEENQKATCDDSQSPKPSEGSQEDDQAFIIPPELNVPPDMTVPDTQKLHAIITKTALFISRQGGQMEVLIKAKQANNPQFAFLSVDGALHPYYKLVLEAIKSEQYNPEKQSEKEESEADQQNDNDDEDDEDDDEPYLHPSLAPSFAKVEAAPSIPSIAYKPSADCAYSMLVNRITGKPPPSKVPPQPEVPAPPLPISGYYQGMPPQHPYFSQGYPPYPVAPQQYSHGPVIYGANGHTNNPSQISAPPIPSSSDANLVQTPLKEPPSLVPYGPTPPKPLSRPSFIVPPAEIQIIIDKMASYVAKNGRDFEAIVKNKGDPRFNFLELSHQYHGYYAHKLTIYEGAVNPRVLTEEELLQKQELKEEKQKKLEELQKKQQRMEEVQKRVKMIEAKKKGDTRFKEDSASKNITTVSFSIKKPKEGETTVIEKRNALPLEESDDDDIDEKKDDNSKSNSPLQGDDSAKSEKETINLEKKSRIDEKDFVDLTDDILEDCQKDLRSKMVEERLKDKLAAAARERMAANSMKEKQLQLERKKKAAMFLSQLQTPINVKSMEKNVITSKRDVDLEEVQAVPSPIRDDETEQTNPVTTPLIHRIKGAEINNKRSRHRSRSRSSSRSRSYSDRDRHRSHKKHKKKKVSHKSYDSPSRSWSHKSKKSKKLSRHRSRSRSPHRHHQSSKNQRKGSSSSNSLSSSP
ncbi:splicing factor, suppressor of white-apricot homolog isoform X2 [Leptopilina heterotoma]|uniref:splicing factor, suppressor of white-apricot homolog isoform X2 n=1 Tax=Leptopilina heterotoma TaxID=63436 RepID=UPI001CAA04B5|nr:splicing factor, suppressor of white-apricot homolog isoform X2 [Leptopilina heterotoma]